MGRKITNESVKAFFEGKKFSTDNTVVTVDGEWTKLLLHGSVIARRKGGRVEISDGGYRSKTTKERLTGICTQVGASVYQKAGVWFVQSKVSEMKPEILPPNLFCCVDEGSPVEALVHHAKEIDKEVT